MLAIVGPTAAGKSELALAVAEAHGADIVSCDSLQVYREMDIGTAKPTAGERARVPHHLIDVVAPDDGFSAARYVELADRAIAQVRARGRRVVLVGGTGLYLRALRFGLFDAPARDVVLREQLLGAEESEPGLLHRRLSAVDPASAARIAPRDLVRLVRALEVHALTGVPLAEHHAAHRRSPRHPLRVVVLDPPLDALGQRIAARTAAMLAGGLVEETRSLLARYGAGLKPLGALGYREVLAHLAGRLPLGELGPTIVSATRKYARRQRTWFRSEPGVERFADAAALLARLAGEWP
jgi:tRNA dimethylallyltransferase